jgi:multiple sugar transport system permease protein
LSRGRRRGRQRLVAHLSAAALLLVLTAPFLWLLQMSVKSNDDIFAMPPKLVFRPTGEHYLAVWASDFPRSLWNSAVVSVTTTLLALVIGVPAAFALSRANARATGPLSFWILATRMAPPIAFTLPYFLAYRYLGLLDTRTGLVVIYLTFNLSLVIWMMRSFFDATPRSLDEAAWIDGAGTGQAFLRISLPLASPGLAATAVLCFLFSWNDFFFALMRHAKEKVLKEIGSPGRTRTCDLVINRRARGLSRRVPRRHKSTTYSAVSVPTRP